MLCENVSQAKRHFVLTCLTAMKLENAGEKKVILIQSCVFNATLAAVYP